MNKLIVVLGFVLLFLGIGNAVQAQSQQLLRSAFKIVTSSSGLAYSMYFILEYDETKDSLQMVKTELAELKKMNIAKHQVKTIDLTQKAEDQLAAKLVMDKASVAKIGSAFKVSTKAIKASQLGRLKGIPVNTVLKEYQLVKPVTIKEYNKNSLPKKSVWQVIKDEFFTWKGLGIIAVILLLKWLNS